mgnify:CR=1 FL=1
MKHQLSIGAFFALCMLLMTACGASGGNTTPSGMQHVQVNETEFTIESSVTTFSPGKPYHFAVTNHGNTAHEFMILPKSEGNMGMGMGDMHKIAFAFIDMIHPGETKTLDYTFVSSAAGSHPEFACYLPGHYDAGMKERVTVNSSLG